MKSSSSFSRFGWSCVALTPFLLSSVAWAEEEVVEICVVSGSLVPKLALYGIPVLVAVGMGFVLSSMWGSKAVRENRISSGEVLAGWMCGLFIGALSFSGLLYAVAERVNKDTKEVLSGASCYPDGWSLIAGILVLITLIVFIVTKMNAKK